MLRPNQLFSNKSPFAFFKKPQPIQQASPSKLQDISADYKNAYQMLVGKPLNHPCYKIVADLLAQIGENCFTTTTFPCENNLPELNFSQVKRLVECNPKAVSALLLDARIASLIDSGEKILALIRISRKFFKFIERYPQLIKHLSNNDEVENIVLLVPEKAELLLFDFNLVSKITHINTLCIIMIFATNLLPRLLATPKIIELLQTWNKAKLNLEIVSSLQKRATAGIADAAFGLGYLYQKGIIVRQDEIQAQAYYAQASQLGHPTAGLIYADYYLTQAKSDIENLHFDRAFNNLEKIPAYHTAYAEAMFLIGEMIFANIEDFIETNNSEHMQQRKQLLAQAILYFHTAASAGYAPAGILRNAALTNYYETSFYTYSNQPEIEQLFELFLEEQAKIAFLNTNEHKLAY